MKKIYSRTHKNNNNYIAEIAVENDNKIYYVVAQLGDLFYGTYDGSYLDYICLKTTVKPQFIEGNDYLWFMDNNPGTIFRKWYEMAYLEASNLEHKDYLEKKYSRLKFKNDIKFEILAKSRLDDLGCLCENSIYEIKVKLLDTNEILYVSSDDYYSGRHSITTYSVIKSFKNNKPLKKLPLEYYEDFKSTRKSKYADLYLALERYADGIDDNDKKS